MAGEWRDRLRLGAALVCSALWLGMAAGWFRGVGRVPVLADLRNAGPKLPSHPSVSVVVAARDEEKAVGLPLRTVMEQDYPYKDRVFGWFGPGGAECAPGIGFVTDVDPRPVLHDVRARPGSLHRTYAWSG